MTPSNSFKPIILDPGLRWRSQSFDLKFDAKWTHQPGSVVSMNHTEDVVVRVTDRTSAAISGMRFSTGDSWIHHAAGERARISVGTKSSNSDKIPFRVAYLPQDSAHSGFYEGVANPAPTVLSFDFEIPSDSNSATHLVIVEPLVDDVDVLITSAGLEIL